MDNDEALYTRSVSVLWRPAYVPQDTSAQPFRLESAPLATAGQGQDGVNGTAQGGWLRTGGAYNEIATAWVSFNTSLLSARVEAVCEGGAGSNMSSVQRACPHIDACNECGGNNSCLDCAGTARVRVGGLPPTLGGTERDRCGTCMVEGEGGEGCRTDCRGVWGGPLGWYMRIMRIIRYE